MKLPFLSDGRQEPKESSVAPVMDHEQFDELSRKIGDGLTVVGEKLSSDTESINRKVDSETKALARQVRDALSFTDNTLQLQRKVEIISRAQSMLEKLEASAAQSVDAVSVIAIADRARYLLRDHFQGKGDPGEHPVQTCIRILEEQTRTKT